MWMSGHGQAHIPELISRRRRQLRFRVGVAACLVLFFSNLLGWGPTLLWALAYAALQGVEAVLFRPDSGFYKNPRLLRVLFLSLLVANSVIFGALSWLWPLVDGSWGMTCGGFLLAGALLNAVLTTVGSRDAFLATATPAFVYLAVEPFIAWRIGSGLASVEAISFASVMLMVTAVQLWTASSSTFRAETVARAELNAREADAVSSGRFLDAVFENVPATLIVKDAQTGRFLLLNKAGEELLGISRDEFIGATDFDLFPEDQAAAFVAADAEAMSLDHPLVIQAEPVMTRNGLRTLKTKKVPILQDGSPKFLLAVAEDITEQQNSDAALLQAKDEAEAANRAKSAFLATVSHEIRTPLNGILGMAQAMSAEALEPNQVNRLALIQDCGHTLLSLLNDILDLSKIESGKLVLERMEFDLEDLVNGVCGPFASLAAKKGLALNVDIDADACGVYASDTTRIRQILQNLLSNALKFTDVGSIDVTVEREGPQILITVADTGIGIPKDRVGELFRKFEQADASTTRRYGGTGLGLAICRELAQALGGAIAVHSVLGAGTTFSVSLPLDRIGDARTANSLGSGASLEVFEELGASLRVLAAEDNLVNQIVLKTLLAQSGVDPTIVSNGQEAVDAWRSGSWDIILMDVQMPVMDGLDAVKAIRALEAELKRPRTPIIALTANAMSHQVATYSEAGMDAFVAKPIDIGQLFASMHAMLKIEPEADLAQRA
jgi:PAS domain S-box-containing protein